MTVLYSEKDDQNPIEQHEPTEYEMKQASFAADFNVKVIAAQRERLVSDEQERERVRKALANTPVVQSLISRLEHLVISAQQAPEEYERVRAEIDGSR